MKHSILLGLGLLAASGQTWAQAPAIISVAPAANAVAAPRSGSLRIGFSQPLTAASAGALRVFSAALGGLRGGGQATVAGSTLTFTPTPYDFRPGETVQYTVTAAAASSGGNLARGRVGQFTTAVGGTGRNTSYTQVFQPSLVSSPSALAAGDLNADGFPDLVSNGNYAQYVVFSFGKGNGSFNSGVVQQVGLRPAAIALGDLDGDGDLDFVTANSGDATLSAALNDGLGQFANSAVQTLAAGTGPAGLALGDLDADGDLDIVATAATAGTLACYLNSGQGRFSAGQVVAVGQQPGPVLLGDFDGDGDLDFAVANGGSASLSLGLNAGNATFSAGPTLATGAQPQALAAGDVDGDGDLDLAVASYAANLVRVALNDGAGSFSNGASLSVQQPRGVALADLDADGDLDLAAASYSTGSVHTALNVGGAFTASTVVRSGASLTALTLADVDKDGDLDLLAADSNYHLTLQLNGSTGPLATALAGAAQPTLAAYPNPAPAGNSAVRVQLPAASTPLELLDALGRVVRSIPPPIPAATLELAGLPPGLYLLRAGGQVTRLVLE